MPCNLADGHLIPQCATPDDIQCRNEPCLRQSSDRYLRRVLFCFWRGQRLREIGPLLKSGGRYEMATREFREGDEVNIALSRRLVKEVVRLNKTLGDPTNL